MLSRACWASGDVNVARREREIPGVFVLLNVEQCTIEAAEQHAQLKTETGTCGKKPFLNVVESDMFGGLSGECHAHNSWISERNSEEE